MRVVLDTNILVSALLTPAGPSAEVLDLAAAGRIRLLVDERILREYHEILNRAKFAFAPSKVAKMFLDLEDELEYVVAGRCGVDLPDPDDRKFLAVALAAGADGIVTGNRRHFPAKACRPMRVFSPGQFIRAYKKSQV